MWLIEGFFLYVDENRYSWKCQNVCIPKPSRSRPAATVREKINEPWSVRDQDWGQSSCERIHESVRKHGFLALNSCSHSVATRLEASKCLKWRSLSPHMASNSFCSSMNELKCCFRLLLMVDSFRRNPSGCINWTLSGKKWPHMPDFEPGGKKKKSSRWRCWVNYPCMTEVPAGVWHCGFESTCGFSPSISPSWQHRLYTHTRLFLF